MLFHGQQGCVLQMFNVNYSFLAPPQVETCSKWNVPKQEGLVHPLAALLLLSYSSLLVVILVTPADTFCLQLFLCLNQVSTRKSPEFQGTHISSLINSLEALHLL